MKKAVVALMVLAGGLFAAPQISVGVGIGVPTPVAVVRPACPGPGYVWMDGYYAPTGVWVAGYWAPPTVVHVAPRFASARVYAPRFGHFRR
jgi:hypothetical protein